METVLKLEKRPKQLALGDILIASGRLDKDKIKQILTDQQQTKRSFGESAVALNLVSQDDIAQALSQQYDFPYLNKGDSNVDESIIAAYQPQSSKVETFRRIRSKLMLRWLAAEKPNKKLAIYAEEPESGCSWMTANLGVVFAQLGERTLVIDCDLRQPSQHELFGCSNKKGLSGILRGAYGPEVIQPVQNLSQLQVLTAGPVPPNPQELLSQSSFGQLLNTLQERFDVILIDAPDNRSGDAQLVLVQTGQTIIMCRKNSSSVEATRLQLEQLRELGVTIAGSVLNTF
ncbi:polysaccharide biosynthesis tyrosine autokinase [Neiella marina]|uniref:Polysaccharide biosynthesis tyrosine autokinase n=1 Tax=Neiella holothuriorum TaxID=2870530 RepID=A0ABS7EE22_9GAMM|nr:polysaccharide biosynthesis tyrosine autokinase [Neiella holothuriorum]MBW8190584.1 polysaccharide biosynthesis tyrosine autokinase [Neiella holothuriorum]